MGGGNVKLPMHQKLMVGGIAGIVGTTCIYPLDMVKTRLQASGQGGSVTYTGPVDVLTRMNAKEGVRGFYRGLGANLVGVTPEKAIKLAVNDLCRETFSQPDGSIKFYHEVLSGATAGFFQVAATNPMEIVKLRVQLQSQLPVVEQALPPGPAPTWNRLLHQPPTSRTPTPAPQKSPTAPYIFSPTSTNSLVVVLLVLTINLALCL